MKFLIALLLLIAPAAAFAADGDPVARCRTYGTWRYCELRMCHDNNGSSSCAEVDLEAKLQSYPDRATFDVISDTCTTDAQYNIVGVSSAGGQTHLYPECSGTNKLALTGASTVTSCRVIDPGHRYMRATIQTNGVTCGVVNIIGRFWTRIR